MGAVFRYTIIAGVGGLTYGALEVLCRGYTHWSMLLTGGLCALLLAGISQMQESGWRKCVMGAALITTVEFGVGCVVNLQLGWAVWDYSQESVNLLGQICPRYTMIWLVLCIPAINLLGRLYTALGYWRQGR